MRYVVTWAARPGGSAEENQQAGRSSLQALSKWSPPEGMELVQFLARVDGEGGFAVVETANPAHLLDTHSKFGPWFEFHVYPVMEMMESVPVFNGAVEWLDSVS
jgi:Protein of unknown function (DUF3303)